MSSFDNEFIYPVKANQNFNYADTARAEWQTANDDGGECSLALFVWPGENPWRSIWRRPVSCTGNVDFQLNFYSFFYYGQFNLNHTSPDGSHNLTLSPIMNVGHDLSLPSRLWVRSDGDQLGSAMTLSSTITTLQPTSSEQTSSSVSSSTSSESQHTTSTTTTAPSQSTTSDTTPRGSLMTLSSIRTVTAANGPQTTSTATAAPSQAESPGLGSGAVVGIVFGVVAALALVAITVFLWRRNRKTQGKVAIPDSAASSAQFLPNEKEAGHGYSEVYGQLEPKEVHAKSRILMSEMPTPGS